MAGIPKDFQSSLVENIAMLWLQNKNPSLRRGRILTSVSNVCEAVPRSADSTNYRKWVSNFLSSWSANRQTALFDRPIMARTQILVHRWRRRTRISALFHRWTWPEFSKVCGPAGVKFHAISLLYLLKISNMSYHPRCLETKTKTRYKPTLNGPQGNGSLFIQ